MIRRLMLLITLFLWPLAASAMLPPETVQYRDKEILAYRQRKMAEYEQRNKLYEVKMIETDRRIRQEMKYPPWRRTAVRSASDAGSEISAPVRESATSHPGRKWMFGLIALFFIGGAVWWVRIATEPES